MSNIFDIRRFGKYISHDLKYLESRYGISMLVTAIIPFAVYFLMGLISCFDKHIGWEIDSTTCIVISYVISLAVVIISSPAKIYGFLTEKKAGSSWILVPASHLEKFLSMVLISTIVVPLSVVIGNFISIEILSLIDSSFENEVITYLKEPLDFTGSVLYVTGKGFPLFFIYVTQSVLLFLLGAICFKKGKAGKTILVSCALSAIVVTIAFLIGEEGLEDAFDRFFSSMTADKLQRFCNILINGLSAFWYIVLGGGIYYRVKSIKH